MHSLESVLSFLPTLYRPLWLQHPAGTGQKVDDTNSPTSRKMLTVVNKFETVYHGEIVRKFKTEKPGPNEVNKFDTDDHGERIKNGKDRIE